MKILITGSTGYIGNRLADRLVKQGLELNLLVRDLNSSNLISGKNIQLFKGDITNAASIAPAIKDCNCVYHCAAIARFSIADRDRFFEVNVTGTKHMLEASLAASVERFVFTSSAGVFGPSLNVPITEDASTPETFESDYDLSKYQAETLVREYVKKGLNAIIINPSRVYGPGPATYSNGVNRMINYLLKKKVVIFPDLDDYRSNYTYVGDLVDGLINAMTLGLPGENYILGGENISYQEFQHLVERSTETKSYILKIPLGIFKFFAFMNTLINKNAELSPSVVARLATHRMLSSEKAIANLNYQITPFKKGLNITIDFLNQEMKKIK